MKCYFIGQRFVYGETLLIKCCLPLGDLYNLLLKSSKNGLKQTKAVLRNIYIYQNYYFINFKFIQTIIFQLTNFFFVNLATSNLDHNNPYISIHLLRISSIILKYCTFKFISKLITTRTITSFAHCVLITNKDCLFLPLPFAFHVACNVWWLHECLRFLSSTLVATTHTTVTTNSGESAAHCFNVLTDDVCAMRRQVAANSRIRLEAYAHIFIFPLPTRPTWDDVWPSRCTTTARTRETAKQTTKCEALNIQRLPWASVQPSVRPYVRRCGDVWKIFCSMTAFTVVSVIVLLLVLLLLFYLIFWRLWLLVVSQLSNTSQQHTTLGCIYKYMYSLTLTHTHTRVCLSSPVRLGLFVQHYCM